MKRWKDWKVEWNMVGVLLWFDVCRRNGPIFSFVVRRVLCQPELLWSIPDAVPQNKTHCAHPMCNVMDHCPG